MKKIPEDNPIFKTLYELGLPATDYVVFGSGPLIVRNIIKNDTDLDIVARGEAWKLATKMGKVEDDDFQTYKRVILVNGKVEVFSGWAPGEWDTDKLIEEADVYNGVRFAKLSDVIRYKKSSTRKKDKEHLKLIMQFLNQKPATHTQD